MRRIIGLVITVVLVIVSSVLLQRALTFDSCINSIVVESLVIERSNGELIDSCEFRQRQADPAVSSELTNLWSIIERVEALNRLQAWLPVPGKKLKLKVSLVSQKDFIEGPGGAILSYSLAQSEIESVVVDLWLNQINEKFVENQWLKMAIGDFLLKAENLSGHLALASQNAGFPFSVLSWSEYCTGQPYFRHQEFCGLSIESLIVNKVMATATEWSLREFLREALFDFYATQDLRDRRKFLLGLKDTMANRGSSYLLHLDVFRDVNTASIQRGIQSYLHQFFSLIPGERNTTEMVVQALFPQQIAWIRQCSIPKITEILERYKEGVESVIYLQDCGEGSWRWDLLKNQGAEAFFTHHAGAVFVRFHLPSLMLWARDFGSHTNFNGTDLSSLSELKKKFRWNALRPDHELKAYRPVSAIDAITILRLAKKN
ncbi:MAG: hypothetical protein H6626_13205 [Pseudobdellovibrionaceae bacterium]|nr:hypothetical protein [Bdellovibrionales bacterium]USN47130.1 MAG: hypothetical protein H6626_13205 [Pseudobdellovibrionaceae bacterium]